MIDIKSINLVKLGKMKKEEIELSNQVGSYE